MPQSRTSYLAVIPVLKWNVVLQEMVQLPGDRKTVIDVSWHDSCNIMTVGMTVVILQLLKL